MTTMNYTEANKLIAGFMGFKSLANGTMRASKEYGGHTIGQDDTVLFQTSWDWLMPVVEKIDTMRVNGQYIDVEIYPDATIIGFQDSETPIVNVNKSGAAEVVFETRLQGTYCAIVAFIQWYNQQQTA